MWMREINEHEFRVDIFHKHRFETDLAIIDVSY